MENDFPPDLNRTTTNLQAWEARQQDIQKSLSYEARLESVREALNRYVYTIGSKVVSVREIVSLADADLFHFVELRHERDAIDLISALSKEGTIHNFLLNKNKQLHMTVKAIYLSEYLKSSGAWLQEYVRVNIPKAEAEVLFMKALNFSTADKETPWVPDPTKGIVLELVQASRPAFEAQLFGMVGKYRIKDIRSIRVARVEMSDAGVSLLVDTIARYELA